MVSDRRDFILFFNDNFESVKQMFFVSKVSMEGTADANARETCKMHAKFAHVLQNYLHQFQ